MTYKRLLFLIGLLAATVLIVSACGAASPETVTVVETVEVEKVVTQEVEKVVEKEVEVVVTQEVEVEKIVEVDMPTFPEGTQLHLLQWSHFVPNYDVWFDQFAQTWGEDNSVEVTVDHINQAELGATLTAALDAGEGPTMVELIIAPSLFVEGVHDLTDINMQAQELFGEQAPTCTANSYLPTNGMWYGFCHGWVPDPGDYDIAMWTQAGFPNGPTTWQELLEGGARIKEELGVPMGLGLSPEIDSNMAMRGIIWSFGGSIQDENECVSINSPEVIEAVEYVVQLYNQTMTEEVFAWDAASNNQGLIAGELSYILNSISAYRSLQKIDPEAADNIGFVEALSGPRGDQHASAHLWYIYVIPKYVEGADLEAAKAFLLHLVANYNQATFNSELYNFPAFESTVPKLFEEGGWPGPANPAVSEVYATHIIPTMMGKAALGELTPEEAVAEAETQIDEIFDKWRDKGFVGCTE